MRPSECKARRVVDITVTGAPRRRSVWPNSASWRVDLRTAASLTGICIAVLLMATPAEGQWDPPAIDVFPDHSAVVTGKDPLATLIIQGRRLFSAKFNRADGAGRPNATGDSKPTIRATREVLFQRLAGPDANSCAGCHNQPFTGGSGDFAANVFVGAHFTDPPTTALLSTVTNERNTTSVFGAGAIEMLAREMSDDLQSLRREAVIKARAAREDVRVELMAKGVAFGHLVVRPDGTYDASGITGVDIDLVIKPFGVKGIAVSLREFTNFALNHHHGIQPVERFGWARTGLVDFDGDGIENEFTIGQVSALTVFQASLPAPVRIPHTDANKAAAAKVGEQKFVEIGCGTCHKPALPLRSLWFFEPNPYNRPGTAVPRDVGGQIAVPLPFAKNSGLFRTDDGAVYVAAFTDLKRHVICDEDDPFFCNEKLRQDFVPTNQFLTTKLWDAGSSAPYGHRGDLTTLSEAIIHHSGEAKEIKKAFLRLSDSDKRGLILFLQTLRNVSETGILDPWR
jgi:hypothetical protein